MSSDPFHEARKSPGLFRCPFQKENIPVVLGYRDLRRVTKDWQTFSSDAPFRVPIPSEEQVRSVRQLPIECDPPRHTSYRKLVEPWFKRPAQTEYKETIRAMIDRQLTDAIRRDELDAVTDFALPLQSRALTVLLNVPEAEAERWITWGTHVFRTGDGAAKGAELETYLQEQFDRASADGSDDFFGLLYRAEFEGRSLTREECLGFGNLAFAGGRDTVINSITGILASLAARPDDFTRLKNEPALRPVAAEEFFRYLSPITHIGRVCPQGADLQGESISSGSRVSLNFAAANSDPEVYPDGGELRIDRLPNPHVAFGSGPHTCLGATHARTLNRSLLDALCDCVQNIQLLHAVPQVEEESTYSRANGFEILKLKLT